MSLRSRLASPGKARTTRPLPRRADRAYLVSGYASDCPRDFRPSMYDDKLHLLDKTISVTVDLSAFGCACNAGFYLVSMPGSDEDVRGAGAGAELGGGEGHPLLTLSYAGRPLPERRRRVLL